MNTFICENCKQEVSDGGEIGTKNRNHCPFCLCSVHVDQETGDRKSDCHGLMTPLGLTFKKEGFDKYGKEKQGEIMLIHECDKCGKISINRIAADDDQENILEVFSSSVKLDQAKKNKIIRENIKLLSQENTNEVKNQLIGKV